MTRPTPEEKTFMMAKKLVKEIWRKDLNRADELTVYREKTTSGESQFITIETSATNSRLIHRSSFEDYFNAGKDKSRKTQAYTHIKSDLEQLTF